MDVIFRQVTLHIHTKIPSLQGRYLVVIDFHDVTHDMSALGLQVATMMTWQRISSRNSQVVHIGDYQIGFMIDYTEKKKKRG
jgi:hypothetical protein